MLLSLISLSCGLQLSFDADWRFNRGDSPLSAKQGCGYSFCEVNFDDSNWRGIETPHDWSIEDLPSRDDDTSTPVLTIRNGTWLFKRGGENQTWSATSFDDKHWSPVTVPGDWRVHSNYTSPNAWGWVRAAAMIASARCCDDNVF